jgi:hypothetical protein
MSSFTYTPGHIAFIKKLRATLPWEEVEVSFNEKYGTDKSHDSLRMAIKNEGGSPGKLKMPELEFDLSDPFIKDLTKRILFIDIETSLINARVFRTGLQQVNASQSTTQTHILTVAGGTLYDMTTQGESGMWSCSNHRSSTFKEDPMDDTEILATVWEELDQAEVVVAHNATFDKGWLFGRFLELGWKLPSRFFLFCTYRTLTPFNMTSKKLDELSKTLIGSKKISTNMDLWMRCSDGEKAAFIEMENYNLGDVYNTLFKVFMRTAYYNPLKAIDFTNPHTEEANCRIDGSVLTPCGTHLNRSNGLSYNLYKNTKAGIVYISRYNTNSKKADVGIVRPHV